MEQAAGPSIARWRARPGQALAASLLRPVFHLLNRPSLAWFGGAACDFALRCNGIAINFEGRHGLTAAEEAFLARIAPALGEGVALDVGANTGAYAMALRRLAPAARIIAFEPQPATHARLLQAPAGARVEALCLALGDSPGELDLHDFADADGSTQASLSREAVALYGAGVVSRRVSVITLDAFLAERGIAHVAYLKVDTEGFDLNVLRGARQALAERRIGLIQFEFIAANIATRVRMRDVFEVLEGYEIHRLCLNGQLLPLAPYDVKRCEIYVNQNLIARPKG